MSYSTTIYKYVDIIPALHESLWQIPYRLVSQMRAPLAACREPAEKLWQLCKVLYALWT